MQDYLPSSCPHCPNVSFDSSKGQKVLEHIRSHILHDEHIDRSLEPCGLCLRSYPGCEFYLQKAKGRDGNWSVNSKKSKCPNLIRFSYGIPEAPTQSSPSSNVPLHCDLCSKSDPAIWRYNFEQHFARAHPKVPTGKYRHIWDLTKFETTEMAKTWKKVVKNRNSQPKRHSNKGKGKRPLEISEAHTSRLALVP